MRKHPEAGHPARPRRWLVRAASVPAVTLASARPSGPHRYRPARGRKAPYSSRSVPAAGGVSTSGDLTTEHRRQA